MSGKSEHFISFLRSLNEATGGHPAVVEAMRIYNAIAEGIRAQHLTVPDSMMMGPAIYDYKGLMKTIPTASSAGGPDIAGNYKNNFVPRAGRCTRDQAAETRSEKWKVPNFKKVHSTASVSTKKLMDRAQAHLPMPVTCCTPTSQMPMRCGYSISGAYNNGYHQGCTTVSGGDAGASASGGGETA